MSNAALAAYVTAERQRRRRYTRETEALFARMSGDTVFAYRAAVDDLVRVFRDIGAFELCEFAHLIAAPTLQIGSLNWIKDAYNLTASDPAPAFVPYRGATPNGSSSYYDIGFNPATAGSALFTVNSGHMGVWHTTDVHNGAGTSFDFGNALARFTNSVTDATVYRIHSTASKTAFDNYATHKMWSLQESGKAWKYYNKGVVSAQGTEPSTAFTNFNFSYGRTAASSAFGLNTVVFGHAGGFVGDTFSARLYDGVGRFLQAVGAI